MKWERGKKGKREALSAATGATYVYVDEILRVAHTKGAWSDLGTFVNLDAAKQAAEEYDLVLADKRIQEVMTHAEGLVLAKEREQLRSLYRDCVTEGPLLSVYRAYCDLRRKGIAHGELVEHMTALSPEDRFYVGRVFEDFYKEGMREK